MSSYQFKCDLCGGVTDAPTYGDFQCQHCGQLWVYDECHRIELSEPQLKTLRDSRWIPVSERLPEQGVNVLAYFDGRLYVGYYDGEQWQDDENFRDCEYWMPLPEPPECP